MPSKSDVTLPTMDDGGYEHSITAVVLAFGSEPLLETCVHALLGSANVAVEVVLVDNGCTDDSVERISRERGVVTLRPTRNLGYSGGCNLGAMHGTGDILVFVNGDAVVEPEALSRLAAALEDPTVGIASGSVRLYQDPAKMNSAGNPVHFLGLSWAGGLGMPASSFSEPLDITGASGAAFAIRRRTWEALGGFWEVMFAYLEDTELSLRCWQRGLRVVFVPDAKIRHRYEFSRNQQKLYLLERNRLLVLLTLYQTRTLLLLALPMAALELALLALSIRQGWFMQKVRGWSWVLSHPRAIGRRRRVVQAARRVPDAAMSHRFTTSIDPSPETGFKAPRIAVAFLRLYWMLIRPLLPRATGVPTKSPRCPSPVAATAKGATHANRGQ